MHPENIVISVILTDVFSSFVSKKTDLLSNLNIMHPKQYYKTTKMSNVHLFYYSTIQRSIVSDIFKNNIIQLHQEVDRSY